MSTTAEIPAHHKPAIPAMVRRAAEAAEAAFHAANTPADASDQPDDPAYPPPADPAPPEPAPAPTDPAPAPAAPADTIDWKHRFDSLKGKHDADVARLTSEVAGLQRVIAAMQAATPAAPAAPAPMSADLTFTPISQQEREDFGDEQISLAERAAMARLAPVIQSLQDKIASLESNVQGVRTFVQTDAKQTAMEYLAREVPDFAVLDTDPGFISWLKELDPFSGVTRQELLDTAVAANNGPRMASFFKAYKSTLTPAPTPNPPANPAAPARGRTSLETFAAPGKGKPGTSAPSAGSPVTGRPVYTQSQISAFYEDVRKGMYRGARAAERASIEQDIIAAAGEGRIVAG